jgi:hypothetical protein
MSNSYTTDRIPCKQEKKNVSRRKLSANFTTVPNELFDHGLSLEAIGLLTYLISRPPDWRVIAKRLCEKFGCGRDRMYRLLDELIAAGFVHRSHSRYGGCGYTVFDQPTEPLPENPEAAPLEPLPENQEVEPLPENPLPENQDALIKTERITRTERKKGSTKTRGRACAREPDPEKPEQAREELAPAALAPRPNPELDLFETDKPHPAEAKQESGFAGKKVSIKGHRLPPDWAPSQDDELYGEQLGFTRAQIWDMAEDMRLWAGANANREIGRKADWHLTFLGWMRRQAQPRGGNRPHQQGYMGIVDDLARNIDERDGLPAGTTARESAARHARACNKWLDDLNDDFNNLTRQ